jgi:hypothetical protein
MDRKLNYTLITHSSLEKQSSPLKLPIWLMGAIIITSTSLLWLNSHTSTQPTPDHSILNNPHDRNPAYLVSGKNAVVASEESRCSTIGINGECFFFFFFFKGDIFFSHLTMVVDLMNCLEQS